MKKREIAAQLAMAKEIEMTANVGRGESGEHEGEGEGEGKPEVGLTEEQLRRVKQVAEDFAALMVTDRIPRMYQASMEMVTVFATKGGMPVDQAIDTLAMAMVITREKVTGSAPRH